MAKRTLNGIEVVRTDTKKAKPGFIRVKLREFYGDRSQTWFKEIPVEQYKKEVRYAAPNKVLTQSEKEHGTQVCEREFSGKQEPHT